jgi:hypothetical protein
VDDDTVVRTLGDGRGQGPRQLRSPWGLAVLDGDVADAAAPDGPVAVVADTWNHRLALWRLHDGTVLGQKVTPLDRAGLYVPGGKASYPSSVLMNAIPAKVAGVPEVVMVVPTPRGEINEIDGLMRALEERYVLLAVLRNAIDGTGRTYLRIGSELPTGFSGVSIVAAGYGPARGDLGTVSLIGPVRMDYALAITTVREASRALSSYVEDVYG